MANFLLRNNISKISPQSIKVVTAKNIDEEWLVSDIDIVLSSNTITAPVIIDFSYSTTSNIEYTLDGGTTFVAFNDGHALTGGQSRFIRVSNGDKLNFRAKLAGNLNRVLIGEP